MQVVPGAVVLVGLDVSVIGSLNLGAPLEVVAAVRSEDRLERTVVGERIEQLREAGSTLGWPAVERIKSPQHHKMKELRSKTGNLRVLFAFDPRRRAVLLVGGDKTDNWKRWYKDNIPKADRLFDQHLRNMGGEGPWRDGGNRSDGRAR